MRGDGGGGEGGGVNAVGKSARWFVTKGGETS